jgi:diadenosine tetraphosphate (Ap4A) HIT family hydrolase
VSLYCTDNFRTADQLTEMQRLEAAGVCLFCPDGLAAQNRQEIVLRTRHWSVTPNAFPYRGTKLHLLLLPDQHAADLLDLDPAVQADFWTVLGQVREQFGLDYYGLGVRNGDCRYTGATITHVHAHVLTGHQAAGPDGPVRMRFSSRPDQAR